MPPKKDGKKKLSKAEKEKLKREEAERKAQEEEDARLAAIEEQKKKKQQEKLEAAERKKLENEEKKVRKSQMAELEEIIQGNKNNLQHMHSERRKNAKWARYMRCDGSPDPTIPGEINTYINLRIEENTRVSPKQVLKDSELDLALISELEDVVADTPEEEMSEGELTQHKTTIEEIQDVIRKKLDIASFEVLCEASSMQDPTSYNLQFVHKNQDIKLCIWGNLSKNPRVRNYEFAEVGVTFDIPRILALSDCAVRVLITKYDHFSMYSKSFLPRIKKKEEIPEPEEVKEEKPEEEEEEKKEGEEGEEGGEGEEGADREDTEDLMAQLHKMEAGEDEEKEEEEDKKEEPEEEEEDFEDPVTPEPPEWEDFEEDDDVVDLRAYTVLGGIFRLDLMTLPPQPKGVNEWTITRLVNPPEIQHMEYVADPPAPPAPAGQTKDQKDAQTQEKEKDKRDEKPPIGVTIKLASDVMYQEEPQVARWDEKHKHWRLDGFSDPNYNEENRTFGFKTFNFGTMALLQETHINMPFQSWEIRPRGVNKAVLSIVAAIVEIDIEIENAMCCVSSQFEDPALQHLKGQMMTPRDLINNLRKAGVNVFPSEDSAKYVSIQNKHPVLEQRTYEQMALTASAMAYSWSKWNGDNEQDKVIFQGAEHFSNERLLEEDWSLYQAGKRQVKQLTMTEFDEVFSDESKHPTLFMSNLYHLIVNTGSEEAKTRIQESSFEFIDCVQQLLEATKVLTYS